MATSFVELMKRGILLLGFIIRHSLLLVIFLQCAKLKLGECDSKHTGVFNDPDRLCAH